MKKLKKKMHCRNEFNRTSVRRKDDELKNKS